MSESDWELCKLYMSGELVCPHCDGTKVFSVSNYPDSRSYSVFEPCPYCDPSSPRNEIPRLREHLGETTTLLRKLLGRVPGALHDEIQELLNHIEAETPPLSEDKTDAQC